jgi:hypothetical protein
MRDETASESSQDEIDSIQQHEDEQLRASYLEQQKRMNCAACGEGQETFWLVFVIPWQTWEEKSEKSPSAGKSDSQHHFESGCQISEEDKGLEHTPGSPEEKPLSEIGGAESGAVGAQMAKLPPDLLAIIEAWPGLSEATKAAFVAMLEAAKGDKC